MPYRKEPLLVLNNLGMPARSRYRTSDVCALLGISPDLFRWRILHGRYPEVERDGWGRVFTLADIERIIKVPPSFYQQRAAAARKRLRGGKPD